MLDIFESMESAAEQRLDEMTAGLKANEFRCGCGKVTPFNEAQMSSASPYSDPCCPACADKIHQQQTAHAGEE